MRQVLCALMLLAASSAWAAKIYVMSVRPGEVQVIIDNRTVLMHHRLFTPLCGGRVFIAIGAMHLTGPRGLLALLRADGYTLTPLW